MLEQALEAMVRPVVAQRGGASDVDTVFTFLMEELDGGLLTREKAEELLEEFLNAERSALTLVGDGRIADRSILVERLVLTHRLTEDEVATGSLLLSVDLAALAGVARIDGGLHTLEGTPLRPRERRLRGAGREGAFQLVTHLLGPPGWLQVFSAGQLVAARAAGGFLALEPVTVAELVAPPADLAGGLDQILDLANQGDGHPVSAEELQLLAALDHETWFGQPRPPFSELVEAAGLEVDGDLVGRPGSWSGYKRMGDMVRAISRHQLPEAETSLLLDLLRKYEAWRDSGGGQSPPPPFGQLRHHWQVAHPVLEELRRRGAGPDELRRLGEATCGPVGAWLASRAAALAGAPDEAEDLNRQALEADPSFVPAVSDAGWYASDRGRARDAVNLLHRVRLPDDEELAALRHFAAASAPSVGRNAPCPCGSGRKFKVCHLGRPSLPEADRVRWLLRKAVQHVLELAPPELVDELTHDSDESMIGIDLVLFEDGWLDRFLAGRGSLLPDIEQEWAQRWSTSHVASLFRVLDVDAADRAVLEDLRTGEPRTVESVPGVDSTAVDRLVWTRLVPVDDRWWTTGVVRFASLAERETLLAVLTPGTPVADQLEALVPEPGQPVLQNTGGDPTVLCTTIFAVPDAQAVVAGLDEHLGRDGDDLRWHSTANTPTMQDAITATFRLSKDTLSLETNSIARRDAAVDLLASIVGPVDVVREKRVPAARARATDTADDLIEMARRSLGVDAPEALLDPWDDDPWDDEEPDDHPETAAVLEDFLKAQEERWLDQPVPALGGRTPRQALEDDFARSDLRTLLAEMDDRHGGFDPDRLRSRLGLPTS